MTSITTKTPKNKERFLSGKKYYSNSYGPDSIWQVDNWRISLCYFLFNGCKELGIPSYANDREGMAKLVTEALTRNKKILYPSQEKLYEDCLRAANWGLETHLKGQAEGFKQTDEQAEINAGANKKRHREAEKRCFVAIESIAQEFLELGIRRIISITEIAKKAGAHFYTAKKAFIRYLARTSGPYIKLLKESNATLKTITSTTSQVLDVAKKFLKRSIYSPEVADKVEITKPVLNRQPRSGGLQSISNILASVIQFPGEVFRE